jgi:nicotinamidase-related amidase
MKKALLIIDIQNDYFHGGANELINSEEASKQAKQLLEVFRQKALPVIHIQHLSVRPGSSFFVPGTKGAAIHSNVIPLENEKVITKHFPNSFRETELLSYLQELEIGQLIIAGMMSHMCVDATARAAKDLGFDIKIAADACATKDLTIQDQQVKAIDVHHAFMAALNYFYAEVKTTNELIEQL